MNLNLVLVLNLILFLSGLKITQSLTLDISQSRKEMYCLGVKIPENHTITGQYLISGEQEENVHFRLFNDGYNIIYEHLMTPRSLFNYSSNETAIKILICIERIDMKPKMWTINWNIVHKSKLEAATLDTVSNLQKILDQISGSLLIIGTYFTSQQVREKLHTEINYLSERYLTVCTIVTISLIIIVSTIEIYLITAFFKKQEERRGLYKKANVQQI